MFIQFSGKCGQKHEIMDKIFESTYEYLSEPRNVHTIFWKIWTKTWNYGQKFWVYLWTFKWTQKCSYNFLENVDKNMKLWTKTWNYGQTFRVYLWTFMNIQVNPESVFHVFVHNFIFLSTFFRKLYEHLNMFIRIGHVSWHLLNY